MNSIEGQLIREQRKIDDLIEKVKNNTKTSENITVNNIGVQTEDINIKLEKNDKIKIAQLTKRVEILYKEIEKYKKRQIETQVNIEQRINELESMIKEILNSIIQN